MDGGDEQTEWNDIASPIFILSASQRLHRDRTLSPPNPSALKQKRNEWFFPFKFQVGSGSADFRSPPSFFLPFPNCNTVSDLFCTSLPTLFATYLSQGCPPPRAPRCISLRSSLPQTTAIYLSSYTLASLCVIFSEMRA